MKYTQEEFIDLVFKMVGDSYCVLGNFEGVKKKIKLKHNICGHIYEPIVYEFINNGTRCPKCAISNKSIGQEAFINRVKDIANDEYLVLGEYTNNSFNIQMRHKKCGQIFSPQPKTFLSGTRCPYCSGRKSNTDTFKSELASLVGDEYILCGEYKNKNTKVSLLHKNCEKIYEVCPVHFLKNGRRCPSCIHRENGVKRLKNPSVFVEQMFEIYNGSFIALDEYRSVKNKIRIQHVKCGEIFLVRPNSLLSKNIGCSKCSQSIPESNIENHLVRNMTKYQRQYKFSNCIGKRKTKLPFDFAILDDADKVSLLIEYDGEQHFSPVFGEEKFKSTKTNDKIKDEYCYKNNIPLLRISYLQKENMFEIINTHLTKLSMQK